VACGRQRDLGRGARAALDEQVGVEAERHRYGAVLRRLERDRDLDRPGADSRPVFEPVREGEQLEGRVPPVPVEACKK
jgi:hypothetical protein